MRTTLALIAATGLALAVSQQSSATEDPAVHPSMADHVMNSAQEGQTLKSLSEADIADLQNGAGWGFARVAELNGIPGPTHLLELTAELGLSPEQIAAVQAIYEQMKADAIVLGTQFIGQEFELQRRFLTDIPNENELETLLNALGASRSQLRFIHLAAHLKTIEILTDGQVASYNQLRGYAPNDL